MGNKPAIIIRSRKPRPLSNQLNEDMGVFRTFGEHTPISTQHLRYGRPSGLNYYINTRHLRQEAQETK
jgi:hypothetical protein